MPESWAVIRSRFPARRTVPSSTAETPSRAPRCRTSSRRPLSANTDVREATLSPSTLPSAWISSSVMPSLRYSFSGSPLALTNGSTAMVRASRAVPGAAAGTISGTEATSASTKSVIDGKRSAGILGQCAGQPQLDRRRHVGPAGTDGCRGLDRMAGHRRPGAGAGERRIAGQHLVEHAREAVLVAPAVEARLGGGLLGTHVRRSADREPMVGDVRAVAGGGGDRGGHAEVGDDRLAFLEQDVLGLDVAVNHPVPVGIAQGRGDRARDPQRHVHRERAFTDQADPQALASGIRHDEVEQPGSGALGLDLAGIVQGQDLGMGQARGDPDLAQEPLRLVVPARRRPEHLDGHLAAVLEVLRQIHRGGASASDLLLESVPVRERSAEQSRLRRMRSHSGKVHGRPGGSGTGVIASIPHPERSEGNLASMLRLRSAQGH